MPGRVEVNAVAGARGNNRGSIQEVAPVAARDLGDGRRELRRFALRARELFGYRPEVDPAGLRQLMRAEYLKADSSLLGFLEVYQRPGRDGGAP